MMAFNGQPISGMSLIDFTCLIQTNFSTVSLNQPLLSSEALSSGLIERLDNELRNNPFTLIAPSGLDLRRLETVGTSLWNSCSQLINARGHIPADARILARAMAFAFALLNKAMAPNVPGWINSWSWALKAAQTCLAANQLELAYGLLSVAAVRLEALQPPYVILDSRLNVSLTTKYWLLRIRLNVAQNRLIMAEHLWTNISTPVSTRDCRMVLETCFLVGDSVFMPDTNSALIWLQRANDALNRLDISTEMAFPDYHDWNLVIQHYIATACLKHRTPRTHVIFVQAMNNLRGLYMEHPAVVLLDISLGITQPTTERTIRAFQHTVGRMRITDANMTTIFHFVYYLNQLDPNAGMKAMETLLLLPLPTGEWTERCLVAFVEHQSKSREPHSTRIKALQGVIKALENRGFPAISKRAAHATVTHICKMTAEALSKNKLGSAVDWLRICNDPKMSSNCSDEYVRTIQLKLIACFEHVGDYTSAHNLMMRGLIQNAYDCKRMYLAYKIALRSGQDCTRFLEDRFPSHAIPHKNMSLTSCAMEAQRLRKPAEFLSCLDVLIKATFEDEIYHSDFSAAEHHIFLICLVLNELEFHCNAKRPCSEDFYDRVETVMDDALYYAQEHHSYEGSDRDVSVTQVQWLYQATYRVGLKLVKLRNLSLLFKALKYSHDFTLLYRDFAGPEANSKAPRPHLFAINHILILAYADVARRATNLDEKINNYLCLHASFKVMEELTGWEDGEEMPTPHTIALEAKHYAEGQFFNFEATIRLGLWDDLLEICRNEKRFPQPQWYPQVFDLILQSGAPLLITAKVMKRFIYSMMELIENNDVNEVYYRMKMPRYLRCLFLVASSNTPREIRPGNFVPFMTDPSLAWEVLGRIYTIAKTEADKEFDPQAAMNLGVIETGSEAYIVGGKNPFPAQELTEVALLAFNKAAEFYRDSLDMECYYWSQKAIDLARLLPGPEGDVLVATLEERAKRLI